MKMSFSVKFFIYLAMASILAEDASVSCLFNFKHDRIIITEAELNVFKTINSTDWVEFTERGTESDNQEKRLESNLVRANVIVQNGSISHVQLLDTLPNADAQQDSAVADKILKTGLYIYNRICAPQGLQGAPCEAILSERELPQNSELARECKNVTGSRANRHSSFRRLLPRHYRDGFYQMYSDPPTPLAISHEFSSSSLQRAPKEQQPVDNESNLAVVQWAQFIGNDLSKPVATTMSNGSPIECCNTQHYNLQPRYYHPACAPLTSKDSSNKYGPDTCLNYVRSALAVGNKCTFAAPEQLNQATGHLDMSPLYGFSETACRRMRSGKDGLLKSTTAAKMEDALLPMVTKDQHLFCVLPPAGSAGIGNTTCFMAGDSRVNSNPFAIVIYTIFMRNHNRLAVDLKRNFPQWSDEQLFQGAKKININIYMNIILDEWLPIVLGTRMANEIKSQRATTSITDEKRISSEYAVAASRFYLSMLPDALQSIGQESQRYDLSKLESSSTNHIEEEESNVFVLKDAFYNNKIDVTPKKVNDILNAVLQQRAMPMDSIYVESLLSDFMNNKRPTHTDWLAFDIQRGRDHGLQPYYKYLEICNTVKINDWNGLRKFIAPEIIDKLRTTYPNWQDIDLVIGGISETPTEDATVGPTYQCIMGEQFAKLSQWHKRESKEFNEKYLDITKYNSIKAADILCLNSNLKYVPSNIFQIASEKNPLLSCAELVSKSTRSL